MEQALWSGLSHGSRWWWMLVSTTLFPMVELLAVGCICGLIGGGYKFAVVWLENEGRALAGAGMKAEPSRVQDFVRAT